MTYINKYCADAGTPNCPCPLAETGDCLICGRLAGKDSCDCMWAGLCIYNEYIQNGSRPSGLRQDRRVRICEKSRYGDDLLTLELAVPRGMALEAEKPGSFVFLRKEGAAEIANVPVSVMAADGEKGRLCLALKVLSAKTKLVAEAEDSLMVRGIYRNGLLGEGLSGLLEDATAQASGNVLGRGRGTGRKKWLVLTKGAGFAPAINLLRWAGGRVDVQMVTDTEKVGDAVVRNCLDRHLRPGKSRVQIAMEPLAKAGRLAAKDFDRVIILASDYYIRTLTERLSIPPDKLVFANNFHMCCGEGICGACGHTDESGNLSKMCKCRSLPGLPGVAWRP